jgi:hypothetical protein
VAEFGDAGAGCGGAEGLCGGLRRTSFSEEKEAKRLLVLRALAMVVPEPAGPEVFLVTFFQKK